jgi:hypothetical protein
MLHTASSRHACPCAHPLKSSRARRPPPHTQVFKYGDSSSGGAPRLEIYFSFGGLLMRLAGDPTKLRTIAVDSAVYLLVRKL